MRRSLSRAQATAAATSACRAGAAQRVVDLGMVDDDQVVAGQRIGHRRQPAAVGVDDEGAFVAVEDMGDGVVHS